MTMRGANVAWICIVSVAAVSVPLTFAQTNGEKAQTLDGTWLGKLKFSGVEVRLVFNVKTDANEVLTATLDSPDQGASGLPIDQISLADGKAVLESSKIGARYEGTMNEDGSELDGKWIQGGVSLPLTMKRVDEVPKPNRPQEPKKPYPYIEEAVTYRNTGDDVTLAATLTIPREGGPFPAVLLITGSGAQDRDETVFGHRPFLVLADFLTRRGIAVLRADDRGVGGSTGNLADATGEDLARDALAGIAYLKTRKEIDPKRLGLIGHSEGGIIAPMVAVQSKDVSFIVLMAGTGVTGEQIIEGQIIRLLKAAGAEQAVIDQSLAIQRQICAIAKQETDVTTLKQKVREALIESSAKLDDKQKQALGYSDADIDAKAAGAALPLFRYFITYDPRLTLRKVTCPVLAIDGALDVQVSADENLPEIEKALKAGGNRDVTTRKLAGLNHLFQTAQTGAISEYVQIEETISPPALETITAWIEDHTRLP
jgi:pimeloyl-ACP methyl ester carboxylesterase